MSKSVTICIAENYKKLSTIKIPTGFIRENNLATGPTNIIVTEPNGKIVFSHQANLNSNGMITRSAAIYSEYQLEVGDEITITVIKSSTLQLETTKIATHRPQIEPKTVFDKQQLSHLHFEVFSPSNLDRWEPENETDVFYAFGLLQDFTDYSYCCGMSQRIINQLGYQYDKDGKSSKPDAIVVQDSSGRYLVAEWKMNSKSFSINHHKNEIDVLVVWDDDSDDKAGLPDHIVELKEIARTAALTAFAGGKPDNENQ